MNMKIRNLTLLFLLGSGMLILISVLSAVSASNTVAPSRADLNTAAIDGNDLKPDACSGINIQNIVDVGAGETGTSANDLILGTSSSDFVIRGGGGDDCILGGAGNESFFFFFGGIYGEAGDDVLIGGPGFDICRGGGGSNLYQGCEIEN